MKNLKIFTNNIEESAKEQIDSLVSLDFFKKTPIRIMPDVHGGKGCVIGFTAKMKNKVIPNIVGVDIGCGVLTVCLGKIKDLNFKDLDDFIKENIPCGFRVNERGIKKSSIDNLYCLNELKNVERLEKSIGTLGGGNHFIELDVDDEENVYLLVHSGSRNIGKQVCEYYQNLAFSKLEGKTDLPKELCYLEKKDLRNYLHDMKICQELAFLNRWTIASKIFIYLSKKYNLYNRTIKYHFDTPHNFIDDKKYIRKGAVPAYKNQYLIIPLNMKDGAIIACGKGNKDWNYSAPHGAGRIMGRKEAKRKLNLSQFQKEMEGIFSTTINENTIDESPMVYKNAQEIINNIEETVDIIKFIKPIYNFKAGDK